MSDCDCEVDPASLDFDRGECICPAKSSDYFEECSNCNLLFGCDDGHYIDIPAHCHLHVWVDGCCLSNGRSNPRGGIGIWFSHDHRCNLAGPLRDDQRHTNQRAEITATFVGIKRAVRMLRQSDCEYYYGIKVHTDSKYVVNAMTNWVYKWRENGWINSQGYAVANTDLLIKLDDYIDYCERSRIRIIFQHVPRNWNQEADELSRQGAMGH